jgi:ankyrin repeat protein
MGRGTLLSVGRLLCMCVFLQRCTARDRLLDACHMADVDMVKQLLSERESDIMSSELPISLTAVDDEHGRTSMLSCGNDPQGESIKALDSQCTEIAKMLYEAGADLNHKDKHGWNAVTFSAVKGMVHLVKYLIKIGVPFDLPDEKGRTPVMIASVHGFTPVIKTLYESGANLSEADEHGWTVLHHVVRQAAADSLFLPACAYIINSIKNSNILDSREEFGRTALMYAAAEGSLEVVDMLLLNGADSRLGDKDGKTALDLAKSLDINRRITEWNIKLTLREHERWLSESQSEFEESDEVGELDYGADMFEGEF